MSHAEDEVREQLEAIIRRQFANIVKRPHAANECTDAILKAADAHATAARAALREQFAEALEAAGSPFCDCSAETNQPTSPLTGEPMPHHCDCRAVAASAMMRGPGTLTRHETACGPMAFDLRHPGFGQAATLMDGLR